MAKKNKKKKQSPHPTLFAFEGGIHYFEEGSMLELYSQITREEWTLIVEETIKYKIFLDCLKEIAFPALNERWTGEDEWFRLQLDVAVSRLRNLDPLLVATHNHEAIYKNYADAMRDGAANLNKFVEQVRAERHSELLTKLIDDLNVSDL